MVHRELRTPTEHETATAYSLSSLPADARRLLSATHAHWSVENSFHRTLDVLFAEDASQVRLYDAPENLAVIHHPAKLSLHASAFAQRLTTYSY